MTRALQGRRCIVTGGGTGIGAAIASCLAQRGASVAVLGRRLGPLRETVAALKAKKAAAYAVTADVRDRDQVRRAVDRAAKMLGGLDLLVNNAGVGGSNACALPGPDRWDEVVRTNLDGVFFTTRAALTRPTGCSRCSTWKSGGGCFWTAPILPRWRTRFGRQHEPPGEGPQAALADRRQGDRCQPPTRWS